MKRLNELEIKVLDKFHLTANHFSLGEGEPVNLSDVATFCMKEGYGNEVYNKETAGALLDRIAEKICEPEDGCTIDDTAAWLLSHYFDSEAIIHLTNKEVIKFLQDWKYFFGFRKMDEQDAARMREYAYEVSVGLYTLCDEEEDIWYEKVLED